jgi:DNA-binding NarL/FixJ family response regulator
MPSQPQARIRIVVADDHPMLREGVQVVIDGEEDMEVVGHASTGREAVKLYRDLRPDLMLIDIQMPDVDGVTAIKQIRAEFAKARLIVLTTYSGDARALEALRAGASGYLLKNSLRRELLDAMRSVHNGGKHLNAEVASQIAVHISDQALTLRERDVLQLVAEGNSNKQIAHRLALSEDTIKGHMKVIFSKLGASDRTHAVTLAARRGMIAI